MKYKIDFITNSSSASFLVAVRGDASKEELKKILSNSVSKFYNEQLVHYDFMMEKLRDLYSPHEVTEDLVLTYIVEELLNEVKGGLNLGGWNTISREYGNESDELLSLYMFSHFDSRNIDKSIMRCQSHM